MDKTVIGVLVLLALSSYSKACFPSKYWISCLIDTCKLGGSCPGDPTAYCRMDKTDCDGCKAVWVNKLGERANCSASRDLELCPGGEPVVHCKVDPCQWPCDHPSFRNAPCQKRYCGQCAAEYLVDGIWSQCPSTSPSDAGAMLPIDTVVNPGTVVGECIIVPCSIEVCINHRCPAVKSAVCRPYACNECKPMWYLGDTPVNCQTGDFIHGLPQIQQPIVQPMGPNVTPFQRTCKPGEPHVPCNYPTACDGQICRNYPNAICRPDGCGSCKATWYIEDKLVDCLSDECPPNVPFVRCVDDPCKYFSHYCPTAECRASRCGKCEAKFFVNGNEIDCVMPAKTCPVGVDAISCPWYTCPANICPANSRLMCRINPCGNECSHEWVDIYNGEIRTCRTFDKEQSPTKQANFRAPESNKIFFRDPIANILDPKQSDVPLYVEKNAAQKQAKPREIIGSRIPINSMPALTGMQPATGEFVQQKPNTGVFKVDPVFVNPGKPVKDADILSLLRSFPYEFSVVSSSAIKNALKKPMPKIDQMGMAVGQIPDQAPHITQMQQGFGGSMSPVSVQTGQVMDKTSSVIPQTNINVPEQTVGFDTPQGMTNLPMNQASGFQQDPVSQIHQTQQDIPMNMFRDNVGTNFAPELNPVNTNIAQELNSMNTNMAPELNPVQSDLHRMSKSTAQIQQANMQTMPEPRQPKTIELQPVSQLLEPMPQSVQQTAPQTVDQSPMTQPIDPSWAQSMEATIANTQTFDQAMALLKELSNKASAADISKSAGGQPMQAPVSTFVEQTPMEQQMKLMTRDIQTISQMAPNSGLVSDSAPVAKPQPKQVTNNAGSTNNGGLPISMSLFRQWGGMP